MPGQWDQAGEVPAFWFVETRPRQWFAKDTAFDGLVRDRFHGLTLQALAGDLNPWGAEAAGGLALSMRAVEKGWLEEEPEQARRQCWLMPLFERFCDPRTADFARRHRDVIARFGRFPHRNAALGRVLSAEALAFLQTPGCRF